MMSRKQSRMSRLALTAACAVALSAGSAFASQGPGGGMGTASSLTQIAMAVIVYGASALIVGTGLIGALRRR
jgi:ABC-type sugar transport system substrate-binding protein